VDRVSAKIRLGCRETRFYEAETKAPKRHVKSNRQLTETKCAHNPRQFGAIRKSREISVCVRLRGGAERTRTSNQTIISRLALSVQ
jgi:hypothetical protein